MGSLKIGEVARRSNVGVETVRYYEREGLLRQPDRRPSGYRIYDESVVTRLRFIRRAKELGFTLSEIKELLALWFDVATRCEHVRRRAEEKIARVEAKIRSLEKMKESLKSIVADCKTRDSVKECPLWSGLDEDGAHAQTANDDVGVP
ncbi:MAG: heavy metal-responsive transcriptional regulator [Isosphaeraceae bacterium]